MSPDEYGARSVVLPVASPSPEDRSTSPGWTLSSSFRRIRSTSAPTLTSHLQNLQRHALSVYNRLTPLQRVGLSLAGLVLLILSILILIYNERILSLLAPVAQKWRSTPAGWLILWTLVFVVSFPPLIGYSTFLSLAGFVYGFPHGWPIVASASLVGSVAAFIASRYVLRGYVSRLMENDKRFAALALTIKHDGLKLLIMIRLCPLPYSLSNGALSTIPTVTWLRFALATAIVSPKLLVHVFIGAQLGRLAEHGGEMDAKTKAVSYISIVVGSMMGVATGWIIYRQTTKRARELEAQEREHSRRESGDRLREEYADDPGALEAMERLREDVQPDDISLRTEEPWDDDLDDDAELGSYYDSPVEEGYDDDTAKADQRK